MTEQGVTFESAGVILAGTLTVPATSKGCVVFVHGSGPLDRDENAKLQKLNVFNSLATILVGAGYASLRYDKRGIGKSGGNYKLLRYSEMVEDVQAAIAFATAQDLGPVYVCGHSEGTLLGPMAGGEVAGLILLCPFVTDPVEILLWQGKRLDREINEMPGFQGKLVRFITGLSGGPLAAQKKVIAKIQSSDGPFIWQGLKRVPVGWLRDFMQSKPRHVHAQVRCPSLLVVAGNDVQCPPSDGAALAALHPKAELVELAGLSHILRDTDAPGLLDYKRQMKEPISPRVGEAMVNWLDRQSV